MRTLVAVVIMFAVLFISAHIVSDMDFNKYLSVSVKLEKLIQLIIPIFIFMCGFPGVRYCISLDERDCLIKTALASKCCISTQKELEILFNKGGINALQARVELFVTAEQRSYCYDVAGAVKTGMIDEFIRAERL